MGSYMEKRLQRERFYLEKNVIDPIKRKKLLSDEPILRKIYSEMTDEYYIIVKPILNSNIFLTTRTELHHENRSAFTHMLQVSWESYKYCKKHGLDFISASIGGLLHDFYLYDWHETPQRETGTFNAHLFQHSDIAIENARKYFPELMNPKVENIITSHHLFGIHVLRKFARSFYGQDYNLIEHKSLYAESRVVKRFDLIMSMDIFSSPRVLVKTIGLDLGAKSANEKIGKLIEELIEQNRVEHLRKDYIK